MTRDHIARRALAQRDLTLVEVGGDVVGSFDRLDQAALAVGHEQADRGVKLCGADSADVTERGRACVVRGLCSYRSPDSSRTVVDHRGSAKGVCWVRNVGGGPKFKIGRASCRERRLSLDG